MEHVCVIAEAGVNHNGSLVLAKRMADVVKASGADYIKFQTFIPEKVVSQYAEKAKYQKENTNADESQLNMLRKLALSKAEFIELRNYCRTIGIGFISTPFDLDSISFLEELDMDFWKVPSGEVTNLPYLEKIAKTGRRVILSTGMCDMQEIADAVSILEKNGSGDITLLHCNTQYPTPYEDVNLRAMETIKNITKKKVGYSDHTNGIEVPIAAVAMGAVVIEKHFTLDKNMIGPDHKASLEPRELAEMVSSIKNIKKAIGSAVKKPSKSEVENRSIVRKSIVAAKKIEKGTLFSKDNLTVKRPGTGISPMRWYDILGVEAKHDYEEDELIEL